MNIYKLNKAIRKWPHWSRENARKRKERMRIASRIANKIRIKDLYPKP